MHLPVHPGPHQEHSHAVANIMQEWRLNSHRPWERIPLATGHFALRGNVIARCRQHVSRANQLLVCGSPRRLGGGGYHDGIGVGMSAADRGKTMRDGYAGDEA